MIKQQIIATENLTDYRRSIQELLNQGWKVIPGTVAVSVGVGQYKEQSYVAVLEKYVPDVTEKMI